MPNVTHTFPVGSFVEFHSLNGMTGRFRIVSHREHSEAYVVRGRNDGRDCWFNFTESEIADRANLYTEPDPW